MELGLSGGPESKVKRHALLKKLDLSLDKSIWATEIGEFTVKDIQYSGLEEWNIKNVVKRMESIYEEK